MSTFSLKTWHLRYHSFSMRERLTNANGNADNQVFRRTGRTDFEFAAVSPARLAIGTDDRGMWGHQRRWRNIDAFGGSGSGIAEKLRETALVAL